MTSDIIVIEPTESHTTALTIVGKLPLDQHPAAVYIASLKSQHSRRNMRRYLDQIAVILGAGDALSCNWGALRYQHTQAIRAQLSDLYKSATVNVMLSALRGVLKETWRLGYTSAEDYQRAIDIKNVRGETLPAGRDLKGGEFLALANVCASDTSAAGIRDAAMMGVLYTCGLRRAELAALQYADFEAEMGKFTVRSGKGNKERTVYASNGALEAVHDWIDVRGTQPGALFTRVLKGGRLTDDGMTAQAVYNMLKKRADEAGVKDFSPHDLRRTFVGDMLDRGVDIATVQRIAGHASPSTTSRYDRRPEEVKRKAAEVLHFPHVPRKRQAK